MTYLKSDIQILDMRDIPKSSWNYFLLENKERMTVFHTQEWMLTLQEAFGYEPKYLVEYTEKANFGYGNIIPFMVDKRYGIKNYLSMPYDTYGGVIGKLDKHDIIDKFRKLPGIGVRYYVDYYSNTHPHDFKVSVRSTELINISGSIDSIWNNIHKGTQRSIKSASMNHVTIHKTSDGLDILDRVPQPLVKSIVNHMIPSEYCVSYIAKIDDDIISASLFFIYGDIALYWAGTTNDIGRKLNAHSIIMWSAIQYAKSMGCTTFSFGASPDNADSLVKFKKSWGTQSHIYFKYQHTPLLVKPLLKMKEILHG